MSGSKPLSATRLSLFTGKGGVGKSTVVAALAVEAARRGQRPLIVELGHRASMTAIFATEDIGHEPTEVRDGVFATNIDLDEVLAQYVAEHVPVAALGRRIAKNRALAHFFQAAPAVGEILTLWRLERLLEGGWDPVLVDFDATGHALMFLELPRVFEGLVPEGPVRRLLDSFSALLEDRETTRLHLVTLAGRLPIQETLELHARLEADHSVPLGTIFVNRAPPPPWPPDYDAALDALLARLPTEHPGRDDLTLLGRAHEQDASARAEIRRLDATDMPRVELPRLGASVRVDQLAELGRLAARGLAGVE